MSTITDLIQAAVAGEPVAMQDSFDALMGDRIAARIDALVPEVSASLFNAPSEE
ncbi:hypothetical protein AAY80_012 [Stenotrophomonas phage vB_SmaS-DLP_6]|nr:hypothetical protein AAY80_012 [Stenotrophomonas phage vB_SmaS-DLP_6]